MYLSKVCRFGTYLVMFFNLTLNSETKSNFVKVIYIHIHICTCTCTHMFWAILYKKGIAHKFQNTFVNTRAVTRSKNKTKTEILFPYISVSNVFFFFIMMHQPSCVRNLFCAFSLFLQCMYDIFYAVFLWWYAKLVGALPPVRVNTRPLTLLCNSEVRVFNVVLQKK